MNLIKLKELEKEFLEKYPAGFMSPEMQEMVKKHKPDKMIALAKAAFAKDKFRNVNEVLENMIKLVSRSSMVSLFEKPKFRDFVNTLSAGECLKLAGGLENFLYGNEEDGFTMMVDVLKGGKLAKWSLITICPLYFRPTQEVFVKPTTVKNVLQFFEIEGLVYKPTPTYDFYFKYRALINKMKKEVDKTLSPDNAYFSGFLMMTMDDRL